MRSRFKAIVFDMDGTLIDSMWAWRGIYREFIREHNLIMPEEMRGTPEFPCGRAARMLLEQLDGMTYEETLEDMYKLVDGHYRQDVEAKPGALAFVRHLKKAGYRVAVATATPLRYANNALRRLGFEGLFDLVVSREEIGLSKKEPEFFTRVAAQLQAQPGECVMFEDALYAMRSAKAAGFAVCAIEDYYAWREKDEILALPDRYIACYQDLLEENWTPEDLS